MKTDKAPFDSGILKKVTDLLYFLAFDYLLASFIYEKGHPVAAGIAAVFLMAISVITVFRDRQFPDMAFPESTLAFDGTLMILAILYICSPSAETKRDGQFLPIMALGFVASLLDVFRLIMQGAFKDRSFGTLFHEQLRLPVWVDVVLLFWPVYSGFTDGWNTLGAVGFAAIGLLVLDLIHNVVILPSVIRKEKQIYADYIRDLQNEKTALAQVDTDKAAFDEETKALLVDRIELIDRILIGRISGNVVFNRRTDREVEKVIADRSSFIESLALHFSFSHPRAIEQLQKQGLSRYEIGLCCLYFMGYNGKEVKDISDTAMIYHVNSAIRQKLGLSANDVNLSTYIRALFDA